MNPFLSIIVPIYNVELYIKKCIDSILTQSFKDFELILVDDASPDLCPQICDEYAKKDERVKVIHQPTNKGIVCARKDGFRLSVGSYIAFVDGDDWIETNMYEMLTVTAKMYKSDIIICDILMSEPDRETKGLQTVKPGLYTKEDLIKKLYPFMLYSGEFFRFGLYPAAWNKIFRRDILEKNLFTIHKDIRMGEDAAFTYPCLLDANSVYVLDHQYLYHYRQIYASMTSAYDSQFLDRVLCLYHYLLKKTNEIGVYDMHCQLYYYLAYLVMEAVKNECSPHNPKTKRQQRMFLKEMLLKTEVAVALKNVQLRDATGKRKLYLWLLKRRHMLLLHMFCILLRRRRKRLEKILKYKEGRCS